MTQDEIMKLAVEAWGDGHEIFWFDDNGIERFAALVAAHEREACAKVCEEAALVIKDAKAMLNASEFMEHGISAGAIYQAEKLAAAIRARGEK